MRKFVATALAVLSLTARVHAEDPPPDAARRAEIAKSGRLAWIDRFGTVTFCDLAGGDAVTADRAHVEWAAWLADGRRVAALAGNRVLVFDAATGKSVDRTADAKTGEQFTSYRPVLSPDGRRIAVWRCDVAKSRETPSGGLSVVGLDVIDLDTGARIDLQASGPWLETDGMTAGWSKTPPAWWTADGTTLYAAVGVELKTLVRCAADGSNAKTVASVAPGRWITQLAPDGPSVVFADEGARRLVIRDTAGRTLLLLDEPARCRRLVWTDDKSALLADISRTDRPVERWRIEREKPPKRDATFDEGLDVPRDAPKWTILERRPMDSPGTQHLWCKDLATGSSIEIGRGSDARAVGDLVVFLRRQGRSEVELWAFDPRDGKSLRLTERPLDLTRYDVFLTPPASRGR